MESLSSVAWLLPLLLLVIIIAAANAGRLLEITLFLVPLSIQLRFVVPDTAADLFLPTEIFLVALLFIVIFWFARGKNGIRETLRSPLTVTGLLFIAWGLFTALTGELPLVSLKSVLTRCWFFAGFYLLPLVMILRGEKVMKLLLIFCAGMVIPSLIFLSKMWDAGLFSQAASYGASRPFFNDHTSFGATAAFCIPVVASALFSSRYSRYLRVALSILLVLLSAALLFSYSRAAWLSMIFAALLFLAIKMRLSFSTLSALAITALIAVALSWNSISVHLSATKTVSSANITEHIRSVSNITSDASNAERINRWKSGIRMAAERPLLGFGPGTYQFLYAPYQKPGEKTPISTNWGELGNIHSEYLGALVDSGIPGLVLYLALLLFFAGRGLKAVYGSSREERIVFTGLVVAMSTYFVHGALNNFLDTDKISAPFWLMMAAVAAYGLRKKSQSEEVGDNN